MTLLAPWALWFAAVGAAIVGLYILKIRRRRQTVPALDFWLQLAGRTKVHSLFDRLKRLLSMLLWLLIAACLVLALGNPILSFGSVKPRSIAVIVDNSASMQASEGDEARDEDRRSRLSAAIEAVHDLTGGRPVSDQWLLIEARREPRVLVPWTHDRKAMNAGADAIEPFNGHGDLGAAVDLAGQLLEGKTEPLVVVISDGGGGALADLAAADPRIVVWSIGSARDNLGITRLAVRRHPQEASHHVLIGVTNASPEVIDTQVTLSIDGSTHSVELVHVEPESSWERTVVIDLPEGGVLRANLERPDRLALDDEAYAILPPVRPAVVWLVSPPNEAFFFEHALAAMAPLVSAEESLTMSLEEYEAARAALAQRTSDGTSGLREPALILFNNVVPKGLPATGRAIVVGAIPEGLAAEAIGALEAPQLFLSPREHPLTQHLSLNGVRMRDALRVRLAERATVLAHSAEGDPLIFLLEAPDRRTLVLAFDVLQTDLPFRNAFPVLLRNAVAFLHSEAPSWLRPRHAIGEPISALRRLGDDVKEVVVASQRRGDGPDAPMTSEETVVPVESGRFAIAGAPTARAIRASTDTAAGEESAYTAVTLCDEAETRIAPIAGEAPPAALGLSRTLFGALPWVALAVIAGLLVALEWMTYSFRWTE